MRPFCAEDAKHPWQKVRRGETGSHENFRGHERLVHNTSWPAISLHASCFACQMWLMRTSLHSHTLCVPMEKSLLGYTQTHRNPNSLVISQKGTCWSIVDACGLVFTSYPQQRRSTLWVTQSYKQSHACAHRTLPKPLKHFFLPPNLFPSCALFSSHFNHSSSPHLSVFPSTPCLFHFPHLS